MDALAWPSRLTGPIFGKELRVSSRRRRNYVLRSVYVILLTSLVALVWLSQLLQGGSSTAVQVSRMSEIGRSVVMIVAWFQFNAAQLLALLLLSDAISDEIRRGTLSVLMTTPITSFQIVMGKLCSKLLQVVLLLAISFPLLALLRIYGGVPWGFVVAALCITLTAVIFVASLSLLLSARKREPYTVIVTGIILLGLAYAGVPLLLLLQRLSSGFLSSAALLVNPFMMMAETTKSIMQGRGGGQPSVAWPLHCVVMLAMSGILLALAVVQVRKAAVSMAFGKQQRRSPGRFFSGKSKRGSDSLGASPQPGRIQRVKGPAIVWKESRKPFLWRRVSNKIAFLILLVLFVTTCLPALYAWGSISGGSGGMVYFQLRNALMGIFSLVTTVRTGAIAASSIAKEKESRAWPILLTTPLEDREIISAKAKAAFLRNWPLWLILILNAVVTPILMMTMFSRTVEASVTLSIVGSVVTVVARLILLIGAGLYFGVRCKSNSTAIIATLGVVFGVTIFVRIVVQIIFITVSMMGLGLGGLSGYIGSVMMISFIASSLGGIVCGLLLMRAARRRVRRNIFGNS